jgi:hypothetical protein
VHLSAVRVAASVHRWSVILLLAVTLAFAVPVARAASLVGTYGGQMEIAAGLELKADGRFRYALSYGALDEEAAGRWTTSGDRVFLTSDRVTPPRFVLVSRDRGADGMLQVSLDVPKGLSRQYFDALITTTSGAAQRKQFAEEGLLSPFTRDNAPTSLRMLLPVFSVAGEPVPLDPSSGYSLRFRFEPNDLGKANFQATPLRIVRGDLFSTGMVERSGSDVAGGELCMKNLILVIGFVIASASIAGAQSGRVGWDGTWAGDRHRSGSPKRTAGRLELSHPMPVLRSAGS